MARAKGIPARGLVGYAHTDNTNLRPTKIEGLVDTTVLHAWPEYFDKEKKRWIQVDPTWGSTTGGINYFNKLDTNHFVFAINGVSSEEPLPAGAYKTASDQIDDVKVEFSEAKTDFEADPKIGYNKEKVVSGFPSTGQISIENRTGRALFSAKAAVSTKEKSLGILEPKEKEIETLLPFEKRSFDLKMRSNSLLDNKEANLTITLLGNDGHRDIKIEQEENIKIKPFFSFEREQIAMLLVFGLVVVSFLYPYFYRWRNRYG